MPKSGGQSPQPTPTKIRAVAIKHSSDSSDGEVSLETVKVSQDEMINAPRLSISRKPTGKSLLELETVDGDLDGGEFSPTQTITSKMKKIVRIRTEQESLNIPTRNIGFFGLQNSGKSTFVKLIKLNYGGGISEDDRQIYHHNILANIFNFLKQVTSYMESQGIQFEDADNANIVQTLEELGDSNSLSTGYYDDEEGLLPIVEAIHKLQNDGGFSQAMRRQEHQPALLYFLDNIDRILQPDYVPSDVDVLMCRVSTQSVGKDLIKYDDDLQLRTMDFGGYRFQRERWGQHFKGGMSCIVFVHSLVSYTLTTDEDANTSQFEESLEVFHQLLREPQLLHSSIVLLFNKKDLLKVMLPDHPLGNYFKDYTGADTYDEAVKYFKAKFIEGLTLDENRQLYCYFTDATNMEATKIAVQKIAQIAVQN